MKSQQATVKKITSILILLFGVFLFFSNPVLGETYEKRQLFFTDVNDYFELDIKISTTDFLPKDNYNNLIEDGDYVCNFSREDLIKSFEKIKDAGDWNLRALRDDFFPEPSPQPFVRDNFFRDRTGDWYFNGGRTVDPPIVWDKEKLEGVRKELIKILNPNTQNNHGKFLDTKASFEGLNLINLIPDAASLIRTSNPTLICSNENEGIACIAIASSGAVVKVFAPSDTNSYELHIFKKKISD
jgi:hypothetical protein